MQNRRTRIFSNFFRRAKSSEDERLPPISPSGRLTVDQPSRRPDSTVSERRSVSPRAPRWSSERLKEEFSKANQEDKWSEVTTYYVTAFESFKEINWAFKVRIS